MTATITPLESLDRPRYIIEGATEQEVLEAANAFCAGWGFVYDPFVDKPAQREDGTWAARAARARSAG